MLLHESVPQFADGKEESTQSALRQTANCVVMVPPKEFRFNEETAQDNEFQHQVSLSQKEVSQKTMLNFRQWLPRCAKKECKWWNLTIQFLMLRRQMRYFQTTGLAQHQTARFIPSQWRVKTVSMRFARKR